MKQPNKIFFIKKLGNSKYYIISLWRTNDNSMNFPYYNAVSFKEFQKGLWQSWDNYLLGGGNEVKLASLLKVKTTQTVRNSFNSGKQGVSDAILSKVCDCLGYDGLIIYNRGVRLYYVKGK